jgi:hypothetical protein
MSIESKSRTAFIALVLLTVVAAGVARADSGADEQIAVTPYRPSVSTPAALSAPGWLEGEAGLLRLGGGGDPWRESLPYTLKLAFTPDWGIRIGGEALVRAPDTDGRSSMGFGDLSLVLKRRFAVNEQSALGLELGISSPTARRALHSGSGNTDFSVNGIYSVDVGGLHSDMNLVLTRLGHVDPGQGSTQQLLAVSLSESISESWGITGEISAMHQTGNGHTAQVLLAASCSPLKAFTWDLGAARTVSGLAPRWSVFAGGTFLIGRLF